MPLLSNIKSLLHKSTVPAGSEEGQASSSAAATQGTSSQQTSSVTGSSSGRRSREASKGQQQHQEIPASRQQPVASGTTTTTPTSSASAAMHNQTINAGSKEQAELLVKRENELKMKRERSQFEGLPEGITLGIKMGDGAFSNVFQATLRPNPAQLAVDPTLGKAVKVAVKCVRKYELNHSQGGLAGKHAQADPNVPKKRPKVTDRANILKEVSIMRGLNHPSIVKLFNFTESRDHYYLTMELMEGGELFHQIVKLTYFSEELSRHVIMQVAHGIRYLHEEKGVVHRDIKPENILFEAIPIIPSRVPKARPYDEEKEDEGEFIPGVGGGGIGRIKIADFGLSKIVWNEETMTPCGTVGYTAPEIVKDERYSKSVDMWAVPCVLYTLLCGFPPFYDESINVLTEKVARGYYTFLSPWWDDISASSKDLITHLLDVNPEKRYTIDEFLAHPWCNEKPPKSAVTPSTLDRLAPGLQPIPRLPLESPLLAPGGHRAAPSPGLASLKEAFDVTYAVHRMEEEGARRRAYNGRGGAGRAGFLQGLNEEEDEDDDIELTRRRYGAEVSKAIEEKRRQVQDPNRAKPKEQPKSNAPYQGWGGADRKMAEAALYDGRAGTRDRGQQNGHARRGGGFDLSLDKATLLGRRKVPLDNAPKLSPIPSGVPVDSPMRVD